MANANWKADFEQALAEEDRSDPFATNMWQNRGLAKLCVATAIFPAAISGFAIYALATETVAHADREWWFDFALKCGVGAIIQVCLGCCALALLKKKKPAAADPFADAKQTSSSSSIGW
jgi:hypothetical protein